MTDAPQFPQTNIIPITPGGVLPRAGEAEARGPSGLRPRALPPEHEHELRGWTEETKRKIVAHYGWLMDRRDAGLPA
jgi:hypothetical protein